MAESSSEPAAADLLIEPTVTTETGSKELIVTPVMEGPGRTLVSDTGARALSGNGDADSPLPGKHLMEEATPTPPESLLLSSENGTVTAVTTEEESVPTLLRHMETEGGANRGGDPGLELDLEDTSSVATAGGSEDQRESTDSASFSIPSLDLSDGVTATGHSLDMEDGLSSSYSALGAEGCCPSTEVPSLKEDKTPEAAGGAVATTAALPPAASSSSSAAAAAEPRPSMPVYYLVKWITWKEKKTPIITQSENGPCPLLAIMNTLFLRWKAQLPAQTEVVTTEDLMAHLGECVLSVTPREKADGMELNFQQSPEMVAAVGKLSYNQLVEKIIDYKHSADSSRVSEGLVAEQFLESTATQLSYHGLCELNTTAKEGEISVFFRNNHFSTMIKHKGHLYLLVTDQGFLQEEGLVWESLHNVEGDGNFCDSDFRLCHQRAPPTSTLPPSAQDQQRQIDQDYLVAVSLQQQQGGAPGPLSDLELARQLQQEEYQHQQQQQQQQQQGSVQAAQQVRGQGSQQARRRDKDSDCVLL
ncbi:ubiquitin carboxyl-terminal hydrolase MINDY-1 isoform X2 [Trachinotus anak]|uniref:ubiquitin carboxyl-terminal hydrolase MINDY-1 isoform X2 n=1 Tax=Trachinotus anak TaxID=443729 RepID=UPI0039F24131